MSSLLGSLNSGAVAVIVAGMVLIGALFVGGRPSDIGGGVKWHWWLGAILIVLLVVFVLSRAASKLPNMT